MKRRDFLIGIGGAAMSPLGAKAQSGSVRRVGYLALGGRPVPPWIDAWLQGLRDNGYEEGRNLKIEWALAAGKRELLPAMAADLVQKNVEVIVAATSLGGVAAKKATRTIPIVVLARCSIVKAQRTYGPRALAEHLGTARTPLVC
jgi:putative ABC transport system substrate-binding protein